MPARVWVGTALIAWVGSLVFAAFGLFMGYLLPSENVMQILGPVLALLAFARRPVRPAGPDRPALRTIAQFTPMYGAQPAGPRAADRRRRHGRLRCSTSWSGCVFAGGAVWRFRKDTARV